MPRKRYTDEEKNRMVDAVDALRNSENLSLLDACRKAKVQPSLYQWWKGKREGKYNYPKRPNVKKTAQLSDSISQAINELNSSNGHSSNIPNRGIPPSGKYSILQRLLKVKMALMELERELMMDGPNEFETNAD